MNAIEELVKVRAENDALRAEIHYLRSIAEPKDDIFRILETGRAKRRVLQRLYNASPAVVAHGNLIQAMDMSWRVIDEGDQLRVCIYQLRKVLTPLGVKIRSHYGDGYSLDAENKKRLQEALNLESE